MNRKDVQNGIIRSWNVVNELGLGETISTPAPLGINEEFRDQLLASQSSYVDIYRTGLRLSHYNFLLSDYSFFQFSWAYQDHVRYCYYPNPFIATEESAAELNESRDMLAAGLINMDDYLDLLGDAESTVGVPPIRYENSPTQHDGLFHPCSHFHLGHHEDNRWAINRIITPFAFTLLILKHYYGPRWREFGADDRDEFRNKFESELIREKMNCRLIGNDLFLPDEAKSFFFS
jgi:hypothetical protein